VIAGQKAGDMLVAQRAGTVIAPEPGKGQQGQGQGQGQTVDVRMPPAVPAERHGMQGQKDERELHMGPGGTGHPGRRRPAEGGLWVRMHGGVLAASPIGHLRVADGGTQWDVQEEHRRDGRGAW
jgi:hypothetical protein